MKKGNKKVIWGTTSLVLITCIVAIFIYFNTYYHSENVDDYMMDSENVKVSTIENGYFFDGPGTDYAYIFYPGAKVEEEAYAPIMYMLAKEGMDCFIVSMPFRFAIFGQNKANDIINTYDYSNWYIGGHSLGGAMSEIYAYKHSDVIDGLILLASYGTKNIKDTDINVISVYGSEDKVLKKEKYDEGLMLLPDGYKELCIEGGNHAWFGNYGLQKHDGTATISHEEQWLQTVSFIIENTITK